ncbi:hypothetical protein BDV96DRAFT_186336 [Lophiotrema nucula]|uniref:Uncharacterized protein n=1 Tax=Lophiotrema nucula TaxID=690887 RepID=A0A6A5YYA7_9PLEO|nr:hypothetical protein BDV96DRAFT_186336 [Lophiotrema nucula]
MRRCAAPPPLAGIVFTSTALKDQGCRRLKYIQIPRGNRLAQRSQLVDMSSHKEEASKPKVKSIYSLASLTASTLVPSVADGSTTLVAREYFPLGLNFTLAKTAKHLQYLLPSRDPGRFHPSCRSGRSSKPRTRSANRKKDKLSPIKKQARSLAMEARRNLMRIVMAL